MIGFLPTPIPAVQTVGGVARAEPVYDSELVSNQVSCLGTQITCFSDYDSFKTVSPAAPNNITKQPDRDTNLSGSGASGLPQGNQAFIYAWSCELNTFNSNLSTAANAVVFEELNRYRRLSAAVFRINQTNAFITRRLVDLVSFEDSMSVSTTHNSVTVIAPDVGNRRGVSMTSTQRYRATRKNPRTGAKEKRVVLVRSSPYVLQPQQQFRVTTGTPAVATGQTFTPTVTFGVVHKFHGILVRGIG